MYTNSFHTPHMFLKFLAITINVKHFVDERYGTKYIIKKILIKKGQTRGLTPRVRLTEASMSKYRVKKKKKIARIVVGHSAGAQGVYATSSIVSMFSLLCSSSSRSAPA